MNILRVMTVIGTRPEAIKLAPVIKEIEKHPDRFNSIVVVTAQHRQMLDQVLELFKVKPLYDLDIMSNNQTLSNVTMRIIERFDPIIKKRESSFNYCARRYNYYFCIQFSRFLS